MLPDSDAYSGSKAELDPGADLDPRADPDPEIDPGSMANPDPETTLFLSSTWP